MHIRRYLLLLFLSISILTIPVCSQAQTPQKPLVFITIPGLMLQDLSAYTSLSKLSNAGASGLMNTNSATKKNLPASYLSISAGQRASWPNQESYSGYQTDELINGNASFEVYRQYTGYNPVNADIVVPNIQAIIEANDDGLIPGLLGATLAANRVPFLFIGNQDSLSEISRPGVFLAMNEKGVIVDGFIDRRTYTRSSNSPTFITTNYAFLYEKTLDFLETKAGIVFLDLGDLARLDNLFENLSTESYGTARENIIGEIDNFLGQLLELRAQHSFNLFIVTPYPDRRSVLSGNSLAPAILLSSDLPSGLLSSASTKRPGLITNLDVAPTILNMTGIDASDSFSGSPVHTEKSTDPLAFLLSLEEKSINNYRLRPLLLKGYVVIQIAVVLATIALLLMCHPYLRIVRPFLLSLTVFPLLFLIAPVLGSLGLLASAFFLTAGSAIIVLFLEKTAGIIKRLTFICLLTSFSIVADLLFGAPLMKSSLLGYCPISGARYYGLGNEYMGVLLGSSIVGSTLLLEMLKNRKYLRLFVVSFIFLVYFVAAPQWGTNVGGSIAFLGGLTLLVLLIYQIKLTPKILALAFLGMIAVFSMLFYFDLTRPIADQTHIGLTARTIKKGGLRTLLPIILRKAAMNLKLFNYSSWTRVLFTFLGTATVLIYRPTGAMQQVFAEHRFFKSGFIAGIVASFIALLVNDSGIVAAATSMIYILVTLLYLITYHIPLGQ